MSHVHNLFHRSNLPAHVPSAPPVSVAAVSEFAGNSPVFSAPPPEMPRLAPEPPALPEFPIEEAHIRPEHRLVYYTEPHGAAADRFRYLRMRLRERWNAGKLKKLLITSPLPHDGKSTVILNLATALSERGQRPVLLIDGDLHKSCLSESLGLRASAGLAECLQDGLDPLSAIRRVSPFGWHLLSAGEPPRNPTELLQTAAVADVIQRVSPHFEWILIDSPPAIALTDAISIQPHADASLLVVRAGSTPREAIEQATGLLGANHIVGIVLNGVDPRKQVYSGCRSYDRK